MEWVILGLLRALQQELFLVLTQLLQDLLTETFTSSDLCFTVVCDGGAYQRSFLDLLDGSGTIILKGGAPYTG